jgi:anti-sigma-K factor RskA
MEGRGTEREEEREAAVCERALPLARIFSHCPCGKDMRTPTHRRLITAASLVLALFLLLTTPTMAAEAQHPLVVSLDAGWTIAGAGRTVTADLPAYALDALAKDGQVPDPLHG